MLITIQVMKLSRLFLIVFLFYSVAHSYEIRSIKIDEAPVLKKVFDATVAILNSEDFHNQNPDTFADRYKMCIPTGFEQEKLWSMCSGVLISKNKILTAGHCISEDTCSDKVFTFDYNKADDVAGLQKDANKIYHCKRVIKHSKPVPQIQLVDYAIVELDREVTDRSPTQIKSQGLNQGLVYGFGHPLGFSKKISEGYINNNQNHFNQTAREPFYKISMNSFAGISGGPLVNERGELVGLIVRGDSNFIHDKFCSYIQTCDEESCPETQIQKLDF